MSNLELEGSFGGVVAFSDNADGSATLPKSSTDCDLHEYRTN